jgi:hypothetical protein
MGGSTNAQVMTQAPAAATDASAGSTGVISTAELLLQLQQDRLWLLRQLDSGHWSDWRLDLAALERELGLVLEQAQEQLIEG